MKNRNMKVISLILSMVLIFGMMPTALAAGFPIEQPPANTTEAKPEAASEAKPEVEAPSVVNLTILHTNDVHARDLENADSKTIGIARLAGYAKSLKAADKNVLMVDAGDSVQGMLLTGLYKGANAPAILKAAGYDFITLGNHEFDFGPAALAKITKALKGKVVSANVVKESTGRFMYAPYVIKTIDDKKIGVFGLSTPETKLKAHPNNTKGITFLDPIAQAKAIVSELTEKGVDYIVCLAHLGVDDESKGVRSIDVAEAVPQINLIVDGHSHTTLNEGKLVGKTLIVSTGEYFNNIGEVSVELSAKGATTTARLIGYEEASKFEPDAATLKLVTKASEKAEKATARVIGKTSVDLDGEREKVRAGETNLARFATDVFRTMTGADVAMTNGGGIRASIKAGKIKIADVFTVFPFGNIIEVKELTGAQLEEAIKHGTKSFPTQAGSMIQVSGLTYEIKAKGGTPTNIKVGGVALDKAKKYTVATNDFMAVGGDGYTMFEKAPLVAYYGSMEQMIIDYIVKNGVKFDDTARLTIVE